MKNSLLWNMKHYFVLLPMFLIPLFFSFIGFVDGNERSQPSRYRNVEVESGGSAEDDDAVQERARYRKFVEIKAGGSAEKALIKYNEWMKKHASLAAKSFDQLSDIEKAQIATLMKDLYGAAGKGDKAFKNVALLIQKGLPNPSSDFQKQNYEHTQINQEINVLMAQTRELMIENMIMEIGKEKKWRIGRSDSGNMSSGLKSDLDQTFYVFELIDGEWRRNDTLDKEFIELFESRWEKKHQILSLEKLDIASIEGKNRFPDPRGISIENYSSAFRGTIVELRNTPGAYTTYGAVAQQMQLRALAAIEDSNKRAFQVYEPIDKGKPDGPWDKKSAFDAKEAKRIMFYEGKLPEIMQSHAFGAAVSNFLELQKYMHKDKFETKYHLRVWDDTMFTSLLLEEGIGRESKLGKEYTDLSIEDRNKYNQVLLEKLFDRPDTRDKHEIALNISRDLRNLHKDKFDKVEAFEGKDYKNADVETKNQYVFDALARKMFNAEGEDRYKPNSTDEADIARTREQIKAAEQMHRQLASEFCMESIHYSSKESFALMLDPDNTEFNPDKVKHLMKVDDVDWPKTKKNLQKAAQLTFLYALYDLGPEESWRLLQELNLNHNLPEQQLKKLWRQGRMQGIIGVWENPKTYFETYKKSVLKSIPELNERVQRHVFSEFGFERVSEATMAHSILETQNLTWNWRKLGKNMFADPGSIDALATISRSFFESDGDPGVVLKTVLDEMFLAIPVIGQIESARRGGLQGVVLMGTAIKFPPVGVVLLVYSIGSTTFTIYDSEVGRPYRGNIEDAIYRGFAGPETVSYGEPGKPPPVFGTEEQKSLDALEFEVRQKHYEYSLISTHRGTPQDKKDQIKQQWLAIKEKNAAPIAELKARKRDFEQYSKKGFWEGGYFGNNASKQQKWISNYLLKEVEPLHGFLTKGVVDFELESAEGEIKSFESAVKSSKNLDEYLENSMKLFELKFRQANYDKSQKYLDHALQKNPELLYRLKRDSLYENLRKNNMVGVDLFVNQWFDKNEKMIAEELVELELLDPDALKERETQVGNWGFQGDPTGKSKAPDYLPDAVKQSVIERMRADIERSRALLAVYKKRNQDMKEKNRENMERSKGLFQMEMTGVVAEELLEDPKMGEFIKALQYAAIPRFKPRVEVTFYKTNSSGQHRGDGNRNGTIMEEFGVDTATKLKVDPTLYHPPYHSTLDFLDSDTLTSALESGKRSNGDLLPETREGLRTLQNELKDGLDKGEIRVAVASVFASGMPDLTYADPATMQGLPGVETGGGKGQVLLGQDIGYFEIKPLTVKADPIRVIVTDWAGNAIDDVEGLVTIADREALMSSGEYWGMYEFTKYDEQIEIKLDYRLPDGESIKQVKRLSVNDFEEWKNPQPPEPITFQLPILNPGTLQLTGSTKVTLKDKKHTVKRVRVECPNLQSTDVLPVGEKFVIEVNEALPVGSPITIQVYGFRRKEYQGKKNLTVPAQPGVIDFGTINVRSITKMVTIPLWDSDNPPPYQDYITELKKLALEPLLKGEKPAPVKKLEGTVYDTAPLAGNEVEQGSRVSVFFYDTFARKVPDVVGLPFEDAIEVLADRGFMQVGTVTGKAPETEAEAESVEKQSIDPGTEHPPDKKIVLTIYDKYKPNITVPRVVEMKEQEATETLTKVQLKIEVMDREKVSPDRESEYRIYRQEPAFNAKVAKNEAVTVWLYDKYSEDPQHGQSVDDGPATPFYVAFRLFIPQPKKAVPKKTKNEGDDAYLNRLKAFFHGLGPDDYHFIPLSDTGKSKEEKPLPFHISKDALKRYPIRDFPPGSRFAVPVQITDEGKSSRIVVLVETINTYNSMGTLIQEFPSIKKNKQLQSFAFTDESGIANIKEDQQEVFVGPLRTGWSDDDRKNAGQFLVFIFELTGSLDLTCFIATAVYQDVYSEEIKVLRQFRDDVMMNSYYGKKLVQLYYERGPGWAEWILKHPHFIKPVRSVLDVSVSLIENRELDYPMFQTGMDYAFFAMHSCLQFLYPDHGPDAQEQSLENISEKAILDLFSKFNTE